MHTQFFKRYNRRVYSLKSILGMDQLKTAINFSILPKHTAEMS